MPYAEVNAVSNTRTGRDNAMQTATPEGNRNAEFDARLSRIEGIVEQMNQRLNNLEAGQRWIIGIQVTSLLTLGTLILVKLG